jgi:hypothetical protein
MSSSKRNHNKTKSGKTPPTPPNKKMYKSFSSSGQACPQEDYHFITCTNCKQTFIYVLSTDLNNTNHCFGQVFAHKDSTSFTCNLNCSFKEPTDSCPNLSPNLTINTSTEAMDTTSVNSPTSDNTISSQTNSPISVDTTNSFLDAPNATQDVTPNVTQNVTQNFDINPTDSTITNVNTNQNTSDPDIIMYDANQTVLQDQQNNKTYAQTVKFKGKNQSTNKPKLPLFSSIIPLNESLPHTFPTNNKYFHSFYNYVLPAIRAFRPGLITFDKTIDTLANNLPNQLIVEWKKDIDLKLFNLQSAKRKFIVKNLCSLLDYIFTKLNYVKFFATKIPPSPHNDRLNVFRNCARFYLYLLNKYTPFSLDDLISKFKPNTPSITFNFTVNPRENYNPNNPYITSIVHTNLRTDIYFNLPPMENMEFNTPSLKNSKVLFDSWFESKFYPCYKIHHPSTPKEKVLGFLRSKIYEEFHKRYFEILTAPPSWNRFKINSLKTRQYAVRQMANWHIKFHKSEEGFETLCDQYWKQSFEHFPIPQNCIHCGVNSDLKKDMHLTKCPIFQSTLILPTIDLSNIITDISEPFPNAKLREAISLAIENIDFKLYFTHNKQKIIDLLFHTNKHTLIDSIIQNFIPSFDNNNQDQDHRQILDNHLKSLQSPPPRSAIFNYCQAMLGTDYAITHTDDIILQAFEPTFDSLLESYDPFQVVAHTETTK